MGYIHKIVLKDKEITDPTVTDFIQEVFAQTGGIPQVSKDLQLFGYGDFPQRAYSLLDEAKKTNEVVLKDVSTNELRLICLSVIASMEDSKDLETLTTLSFDKAMNLIRKM